MSNVEKYVEARVGHYIELFNRAFDRKKQARLQAESDALWPTLTDEEKREAERGYFAGVQDFNRRDPNFKGWNQK